MNQLQLNTLIAAVATGGLQTREEAASKLLTQPIGPLIDFLFDKIEGRNFRERNAAIEMIARLGPAAWEPISLRLDRLSNEGKMFITPALADFLDRRTLKYLHHWATLGDPNLGATVCDALAKIRDKSSIPVLRDLADSDLWLAGPAMTALGKIGLPEVVPILTKYLGDEDLRPFVVAALAGVPHRNAWPPLSQGVRDDATLVAVALQHGEPLFKILLPTEIRQHANPKNIWIFAAREGLRDPSARLASVKLISALADAGSLRKLVEIYLFENDDDELRRAITVLPDPLPVLNEYISPNLGDEATRRLVHLLVTVSPNAETTLRFLAHPSASVRLEVVLGLRRTIKTYAGVFASLLGDPDEIVRKTVLQALRNHWHDAAVAQKIATELDFTALESDVLLALSREAPEPIPSRIRAHLAGLGSRRRSDQESVHMLLELRANPEQKLNQLLQQNASGKLTIEELTALAKSDDRRIVQMLLDCITRSPDQQIQYMAAEFLIEHPAATQTDIERALRTCNNAGAIAALASFTRINEPKRFAQCLIALPLMLPAQTELAILRALRLCQPELAKSRFQRALAQPQWYLQAEGWRGLLLATHDQGENWPINYAELHPVARELLEAVT